MTTYDTGYLALLIFLYALFEFFLRGVWKPSRESAPGGRGAVVRAAILLVVLIAGTSGILSFTLALGELGVAAVYAFFELAWGRGATREAPKNALEKFMVKQISMGILLLIAWRSASPLTPHGWCVIAWEMVLDGFGPVADVLQAKSTLILAIATSYLVVIDGGTRIVRGILGRFPGLYRRVLERLNAGDNRAGTPDSEENVGEWIGILERVITLTFVLTGNFTAIAFVLTAKSIARFKELEQNKDFAEYYLLGTSGSMIVALGVGMITRILFGL